MNKIFRYSLFVSLLTSYIVLFCAAAACYAQAASSMQQDKISLDIKGMDAVDVLKMLAARAGMNIVVGKNVTGRVTLFLKDVNVWDAFEIILLANDLAYEKTGDIVNVMSQRDYELQYGERYKDKKVAKIIPLKYAKAQDLSRALNQIKSNIGKIVVDEGSNTLVLIDAPEKIKAMESFIKEADLPIATRVFSLGYAQAEKINPKIQEAITKGVGSIKVDERTNKIAVTDYPARLDEIGGIIKAFDEKTPQVLIDAQIIEIKPSDKFEMGVDWDYWIKKNFRVSAALPISATTKLSLGTIGSVVSGQGDYKAILDILRTIGDTKILSSPRIMALNNQEAKILVGTKDAYITSTTSQGGTGTTVTSQSVNFVDVGIKLYVTPVINRDGFVTMKIKPEISSAERTDITSEGKVTQIPIVTTSESETTVMVKDGVTIIIGGLKKDERSKSVKKIPLLGDIPGLGFFFRSTTDDTRKTELVILLTPHVMSGEVSYTDFTEIKPVEGAVADMAGGDIVISKVSQSQESQRLERVLKVYRNSVIEKISSQVSSVKPDSTSGSVTLSFVLDSGGYLKGRPKIQSSTNKALDEVSIACVENASPFDPFPAEIEKYQEIFSITLEYK